MTRKSEPRRGEQEAAGQLWELLLRPGPCRDRWQRRARNDHLTVLHDKVNCEAVRRVLVDHLRSVGELRDDQSGYGRRSRPWKDQVYDVVNGVRLSIHTLEIFVDAFGIAEAEAERLRAVHSGDISVKSGS